MKNSKKRRLSNKEFWDALIESGGLFARCSRLIKEKHGVEITRQAIRQRAEKMPERLFEITEISLDNAEEQLLQLFESKNERIRLKAVEFYLKNKGKARGYAERTEITGADGEPIQKQPIDLSHLTDEELAVLGRAMGFDN